MLLPWTLLRCVLMLASSKTTWCFLNLRDFLIPPSLSMLLILWFSWHLWESLWHSAWQEGTRRASWWGTGGIEQSYTTLTQCDRVKCCEHWLGKLGRSYAKGGRRWWNAWRRSTVETLGHLAETMRPWCPWCPDAETWMVSRCNYT